MKYQIWGVFSFFDDILGIRPSGLEIPPAGEGDTTLVAELGKPSPLAVSTHPGRRTWNPWFLMDKQP